MRKIKFHSDQNKMSMQKKENSMPWYNNEYKEAKKLMRKARQQFMSSTLRHISYANFRVWYRALGI